MLRVQGLQRRCGVFGSSDLKHMWIRHSLRWKVILTGPSFPIAIAVFLGLLRKWQTRIRRGLMLKGLLKGLIKGLMKGLLKGFAEGPAEGAAQRSGSRCRIDNSEGKWIRQHSARRQIFLKRARSLRGSRVSMFSTLSRVFAFENYPR